MSKFVDEFKKPQNGYTERGATPFSIILCLTFGLLYFLTKGNFKHFQISTILWIITTNFYSISWLLYPLFVYEINKEHYLKRGWAAV